MTCMIAVGICAARAEDSAAKFKVIAFYTGKDDLAHISFVKEANRWFAQASTKHHFSYEATTNWTDLKDETLARHQVVLFLDTRPEVHGVSMTMSSYHAVTEVCVPSESVKTPMLTIFGTDCILKTFS